MAQEKKPFIQVDELLPQVTVEQAAAFYGTPLPELHRLGAETRSRCFLNCGRTQDTGDRVLSIQESHPAKQWHCHQYGCGKSGNLVSLCDLLKPGTPSGGKPRGDRFKGIAADLQAMVQGVLSTDARAPRTPSVQPPLTARVNVPLAESENERARGLVSLSDKFVVEPASMPPKASAYLRRRPFLSPEVCRRWSVGYLPRDAGPDKAGGTMRGRFVYPFRGVEGGEVLTWFGRDPEWEEKHAAWETTDKAEREPEKFHFVKGFHRGLELFGQDRIAKPEAKEALKRLGLVLVEGPNDVIRLDTLGVPAVGLCSNTITREQASKAALLARTHGNGVVTVFLDCDPEGEAGMKQCLGYLAQLTPVRLAWTTKMYGGKYKGRQPESLSIKEWQEIEAYLMVGEANGWTLT